MTGTDPYCVVRVRPGHKELTLLLYRRDWAEYLALLRGAMPVKRIAGSLDDLGPAIDGVLCWMLPAAVLDQLPNVQWIQVTSSGVDHLVDALSKRDRRVMVSTVQGMNAESVAGFALLSILAHHWRLPLLLEQQRRHEWKLRAAVPFAQSTCAVIGMGKIGERVAEHAKHLGMRVLGVRRSEECLAAVDELFPPEHVDRVLIKADYVVLTVPLTASTRGMIGRHQLQLMKPTAVLVNVARGPIVDEEALRDALINGEIAGASVDVTSAEPLPPGDPLWDTPNLIITPHVAGERTDYREAVAEIWIANIHRISDGHCPSPIAKWGSP